MKIGNYTSCTFTRCLNGTAILEVQVLTFIKTALYFNSQLLADLWHMSNQESLRRIIQNLIIPIYYFFQSHNCSSSVTPRTFPVKVAKGVVAKVNSGGGGQSIFRHGCR